MMIRTTIFPGRYIQGFQATQRLGAEIARLSRSAFMICDPFVLENILPRFLKSLRQRIEVTSENFNGECSDEEIDRLSSLAEAASSGVIAGLGGGKTLDTAKAVADRLQRPAVMIPTSASTDAPCSALAVVYTKEGRFKRYYWLKQNPAVVLVDTQIIAQAPIRLLVAGMGDALATWFEVESVHRSYSSNLTGDRSTLAARCLARLCFDTLIDYGVQAKAAAEMNVVTPALENIVEANTLLSGLGFESGGLAAAHAIHNGLSTNPDTHSCYHGEMVAFGTLASLFLTDQPRSLIEQVYSFCQTVGLPTIFSAVGLLNADTDILMDIARVACAEGETIHNEGFPISPEMVVAALKTANAYGETRKLNNLD